MADKEKRRSGVTLTGMPEGKATKSDSDRDFLSQAGVGELLRGAILKMVEARSDDPIGFLADHFCNLASVTETGTAGCGDGDQLNNGPLSAGAQEQQHLNRALWHLRLAHHSQRSAFSNNVRVAYDLLNLTGPGRDPGEAPEGPDGSSTDSPTGGGGGGRGGGGGVRGGLYTQTLQCLCSEGGVPASTSAPLLRRLHCQDHEAVPYDVFRHGVLTCAVFSDYIRQAQRLYAEVCCPDEGPASRALCLAVLGTLKEALETSQGCDANCCANANTKANSCLETNVKAIRYLEASAKISPCKLAQAMSGAQTRGPGGNMDAKEFENAAAELFITRVKVVAVVKMEEEEQLRSFMFLMTYMLLKRRRDINNANIQRRNEIQRRIRHRQYFFQRQRRMLMMMIAGSIRSNVRIRTRPWTTTPSTDWWERVVMMEFQPSDWLDKFRMSRETFFYLCDKLRPRLARQDTSFRLALPVEKRVAVALWRLASNIEYRTISTLFGVGKSTVCRCVRDMCHAIVALLSSIYLRPPNEQELEDSAQLFLSHFDFPHCVAAIATLHTAIITPSNNASDYANPAGWLSVLSQVAVSGRGQFWDVCASFPGGTDPADILQNSSLWATAAEGGLSPTPLRVFMGKPLRYVLLGEACYPLQSWLMKTYPEEKGRRGSHAALTEPQQLFNQRLTRALRVSEEALLRLRARWQCLSKRNDCGLDVVPTMILACCILHNMCESHGDDFKAEWQVEVAEAESPQPSHKQLLSTSMDQSHAEEVRHLFCEYFEQQINA